MDAAGEGERGHIDTTTCRQASCWEAAGSSVMTGGMGWEGRAEGTCLSLQVIHTVVQWKPAECCKAIILQLSE